MRLQLLNDLRGSNYYKEGVLVPGSFKQLGILTGPRTKNMILPIHKFHSVITFG